MKDLILKKAYSLLAVRAYFTSELKYKLLLKFTDENLNFVDSIILELIEQKLLDDSLTAKAYIEELQRKRFGKKYIVNKFLRKGLSIDFAKSSIQSYYNAKLEKDNISFLKQKKQLDNSIKSKFKFNNFLKQRGF